MMAEENRSKYIIFTRQKSQEEPGFIFQIEAEKNKGPGHTNFKEEYGEICIKCDQRLDAAKFN